VAVISQLLNKKRQLPETSLLFFSVIFAYNLKVQFVLEASPMFTKSGELCIHGMDVEAIRCR